MTALTLCSHVDARGVACRELVARGMCETHRLEARRESDARRPSSTARGYDHRWAAFAKAFLLEHPLCECEDCIALPARLRPVAVDVHHRDGRGPLGPRGFDPSNCRAMAHDHHSRQTARDQPGGFAAALVGISPNEISAATAMQDRANGKAARELARAAAAGERWRAAEGVGVTPTARGVAPPKGVVRRSYESGDPAEGGNVAGLDELGEPPAAFLLGAAASISTLPMSEREKTAAGRRHAHRGPFGFARALGQGVE